MRKKTRQKNKRFLLVVTLCLFAWAGCAQKETAPPPKQPLPAKAAAPDATQPAPVVAPAAAPTATPGAAKPVQKQPSSARVAAVPAPKPPVQGQPSSARAVAGSPVAVIDFTGKKDPFKPFIVPQAEKKAAPVESRSRRPRGEVLPIQSVETEKFKVSGIIVGLKENSALVIDPAGKGYVIKEGMQIGSNNGVVSRITPNAVEIVEKFEADNGRMRTRTIKLTLVRKGKESPR